LRNLTARWIRAAKMGIVKMAVPPMGPGIGNTGYTPATGTANVREDLADVIYEIDPWETPFVSAAGNKEAEQPLTEWLVQELQPADDNAQVEGFRYAAMPIKGTDRMNNVCQIMVRSVTVSNTFRVSNTVGGDEFDRQTLLKAKELRRDLEYCVTRGTVKASPAAPGVRRMSGFQTWVTNGSMGAGGGLVANGNGSAAPVAGTARPLTLDLVGDAMEQAFTVGGHPNLALMSPRLKRLFSSLSQGGSGNPIAAMNIVQATTPAPTTLVGAVDIYLSDFGRIQLAPDIFMPNNVIELIDPDFMELAPLPGRDMVLEEYAKAGDAADGAMIFEGTLRPTAPKAHAMVGDLDITVTP
jgi:Family of unknown function (DUF5309)